MTAGSVRFSVVLPCYNERENLPGLLRAYAGIWEDLPTELVLVDNGSNDGTAEYLARETDREEYGFARVVRVEHNQGYGHGLYAGLKAARGEIVGFSHADQQCPPVDLFVAYHELCTAPAPEATLVKGRRRGREPGPTLITAGMSLLASTLLLELLSDVNAQPKVFFRSHLDRLTDPPAGFEFDLYVLHQARQAGLEIRTIPVRFERRAHGSSKWAFSLPSRLKTMWEMASYILQLRRGAAR